MCGIVGWSGAVEPRQLAAAVERLAHRGPDAEGLWWDEGVGVALGHRRLAIIDLSPAARQPLWDATGQVAIVFNGEICKKHWRMGKRQAFTLGGFAVRMPAAGARPVPVRKV